MSTTTCRICGFPAAQHTVELADGVAHTVVRGVDGKTLSCCSTEAASRDYLRGEISRLRTIVRSLRNRAGRAWRKEQDERARALEVYAVFIERERDWLIDAEARWYEW